MPIIKSAIKRAQIAEVRRARNNATKTVVRKKTKAAMISFDAKDQAKSREALIAAISEIDKAAKRGVLHKNTAARRKAQLTRNYNAASKQAFGTEKAATKPATPKKS